MDRPSTIVLCSVVPGIGCNIRFGDEVGIPLQVIYRSRDNFQSRVKSSPKLT